MKSKKILFLDNDVMSYFLVSYLLIDEDCEVIHCRFARKALKMLKEDKSIALVISELILPDSEGFSVIKQIRDINPFLPVIAQTSHILIDIKSQCLKAGFNEFLSKPADVDVLLRLIKKYLQSSGKSDKRLRMPIF